MLREVQEWFFDIVAVQKKLHKWYFADCIRDEKTVVTRKASSHFADDVVAALKLEQEVNLDVAMGEIEGQDSYFDSGLRRAHHSVETPGR